MELLSQPQTRTIQYNIVSSISTILCATLYLTGQDIEDSLMKVHDRVVAALVLVDHLRQTGHNNTHTHGGGYGAQIYGQCHRTFSDPF